MKKTYILALAALAMAFSCQKAENSPEATSEPVVRTFTCTFAQPDTKLAIDSEGKTTWEVGDQILVHGEGSSNRQIITLDTGDISADGKTATITVTVTPYERPDKGYISTYYASYPASAVPSGNQYYYARFNDTNLPLMAAYDKGDSFVFTNICGVLSFKVSGDFDTYVFSGNNDETIGYTIFQARVVNKTGNVEQLEIPYSGDGLPSGPQKSITGDVYDDGTTINSIYFPNGANFTGGFTIKFLKSGSVVKTLSTTKSVDVPRNSYRPMGDVTAYLKTYVPPTSHNSSIDMTGATPLDGSGTANCYIVDGSVAANAEKVFTFKAYKGNSTTGVGTIASAEILWETWNNAESVTAKSVIAAVDFDKQEANDYYTMVFKMPATLHAGNALIAAKDAGDNILWSWHIWVPETSVMADATGVGGMAQAGILDRNLGALVVTSPSAADASIQSAGLMYQWGRKDPFMGPSAFGTNSAATVNGTAKTNVTEQQTEAWTIQNPTVFIAYNGDWSTVVNNDIWADSDDKAKSISDPCPPGYRVPQRKTSLRLWSGTSLVGEASWELDATHYWFKVGTPKPVVFPIAGYIYKSGGYDQSGTEAYIWTAHKGSDTIAYALRLKSDGTTKNEQPVKASGANVRCVGIAE